MIPKIYKNKPLIHSWQYKGLQGELLGVVGRYQVEGQKKDVVPYFKRQGADWLPGINIEPRPLFGLEQFSSHPKDKAVFVVEGEKCAAALQSIGLCSISTLGGAQAPHKADFSPLNGFSTVCILPDNDEAGGKYAATIREILANLGQPPKVKTVFLPGLADNGDIVDWLQGLVPGWDGYSPIDDKYHDDLKTKLRAEIANPDNAYSGNAANHDAELGSWARPGVIQSKTLPVKPMISALIPAPCRDWLADVAHRMQTPADFPVISFMVVASSVIGAGCSIRPKRLDGWEVIPNLWGACVGRPSVCLKSPSMKEALAPLDRLQCVYGEIFEREKQEGDFDGLVNGAIAKDLKSRLEKEAKKSTMDAQEVSMMKAEFMLASESAAQQPIRRLFKTNETTIQSMTHLQSQNPRGLLVFRDELTGLLSKWSREDGNEERMYFVEGWNGNGQYTDVKISRGVTEAKNICISLLGGIQPDRLKDILTQARAGGNDGLFQRFQLAVWPDEPKNWQLIDSQPNRGHKQNAFVILQKLAQMDFVEYGASKEEHDDRPFFRFDEAAQAVFNAWLTRLQTEIIPNEDNPLMAEHFGKYRSLMPSMALIFHLIEVADGKANGSVTERSALLAVEWCKYLESHARRIYAMTATPEQEAAVKLAEKIKAGCLSSPFTTRDVERKGWHGLGTSGAIKEACQILQDEGWIVEQLPEMPAIGRRRLPEYFINPLVLRK